MAQQISARPVVLVVEDDILVRMDAVDMVKEAGHDAMEASSADEAIEILERCFDIRVVFTDIQMPGSMDGLRLAAAVRERWPPIKIIAASGHVHVSDDDLPSGSRFIPKPYLGRGVAAHLKELTEFEPAS